MRLTLAVVVLLPTLLFLGSSMTSAQEVPVTLQSGTATFSQGCAEGHTPDFSVNDDFFDRHGWAISRTCAAGDDTFYEVAVWETETDFSTTQINVRLHQNIENQHYLGRFRLSLTSDDRSTFADDLDNGGDVGATWTVLTSPVVSGPAGMTFTILGDDSILAGGLPPAASAIYDIQYTGTYVDITGIRLEVLEDPSLPFNGPGLQPTNGNFVLSEIQVFCPVATRAGNVDTGTGGPAVDVVFVNGSAGDPVERKVTVTAGVPATLHIDKAPSTPGPRGGYGYWIYDGDLRGCVDIQIKKSSGEIVPLGQANGCMPINNSVTPGSCPCPLTFPLGKTAGTMSVPKAALFCLTQPASPKSPTDFMVTFPAGTFTILSVHLDRNAPASPAKNIAIGNTIVVVSEP